MRRPLLALLVLLAAPAASADPQLGRDPAVPAAPPAPVRSLGDCAFSPRERALAVLLLVDPRQQRPRLVCTPALMAYARHRAADMAARGYFAHVTPDKLGPNALLRAQGYPLPPGYGDGRANNVEAIAADLADPAELWAKFADSDAHRMHLLGEHAFYAAQDEFGVAHVFARDSAFKDYWVVVIARRARADDPQTMCEPPPGGCFTK
jgi:hypothetical protein